jgi:hypothetical protein
MRLKLRVVGTLREVAPPGARGRLVVIVCLRRRHIRGLGRVRLLGGGRTVREAPLLATAAKTQISISATIGFGGGEGEGEWRGI